MTLCHSDDQAASSSREYGAKSSCKGSSWKLCDVCKSDYNTADKRPTILICGHTFCRECLSIVSRRGGGGALPCPSCRTLESRPLASLPPNASLMAVLLEQLEDKLVQRWCGGDACSGLPLSYEQQVEYAILLSRQQTQEKGQDNVAANWREVDETQDKSLALALQDSEMFEASRLCALRYLAGASLNPPHKHLTSLCLTVTSLCLTVTSHHLPRLLGEEEASLRLALQLHQEEVASMQRQGRGQGSCWSEAEDPCDWRKDYQMYFGASLCHLNVSIMSFLDLKQGMVSRWWARARMNSSLACYSTTAAAASVTCFTTLLVL
ncbi:RING finger protein 223 [Chionoecetes opilio]|uniref:RING finger protein 223 n=1 Tax=Chionoecetes opilio TaxID=41210 RepID=A0A8J5CCW3_CHIOP|nr:RING finger protein 223 [Chionoecetes opilio]